MFSGVKPPFQIFSGAAHHFLCNPKLSLTSLSLGLKERFGRVVTEVVTNQRQGHAQPEGTATERRRAPASSAGKRPRRERSDRGPEPRR